ncbi:hypothetical protein [Sphingobacterium sp. BIGb0116]|uniref:hypothetical protein n=1 Tax=Sphingobacterium sp. BIGb0116 TaxID=2940619 RepID=UPI002168A85C|nr:hypothetical protein [Sphingobacterium sp. BIGb0116]MCS4163789.1 hypothetical protein [Sphingobacterium sp. BIGb0116]
MFKFDNRFTIFNSIIFSILLIALSVVVFFTNEEAIPFVTVVMSSIIFFSLVLKFDKTPALKFFFSYGLILVVLFRNNPNLPVNFLYLISPIISSFSTVTRKDLKYIIPLPIIAYLILLVIYNSYTFLSWRTFILPAVGFIYLFFLAWLNSVRSSVRFVIHQLEEIINNYYIRKGYLKHVYKFYGEFIPILNNHLWTFNPLIGNNKKLIKDIICYAVINNRLVVVNGSKFVWKSRIEDGLLDTLRAKGITYNVRSKFDLINSENNIFLYSVAQDYEYVYAFLLEGDLDFLYKGFDFFQMFSPIFNKISNILVAEKDLSDQRNETTRELSKKRQYVTYAIKTMHFIRNHLGSYSNLIKMLEDIGKMPTDKKKIMDRHIESEVARSRIELKTITDRASYLLEKNDNPYNFLTVKKVSIVKIYAILARTFSVYFPNLEVKIHNIPESNTRHVNINEEGLEVFLSDWLNNIQKYSKNKIECDFVISKDNLSITFSNDYSQPASEIDKLILDLNSDDRREILKRTTHGIALMKDALNEMDVFLEARHDAPLSIIIVRIDIKIIDENSCI